MNRSLLILSLLLISLGSKSQVEQLARWEVEHDWGNRDYAVISNEDEGVLIIQPDYNEGLKDYPLAIYHLDTNLQPLWADTLKVERQMFLRGYHYQKNKTFLLFQNGNQTKEIKLVVIDLPNKELKEYEPKSIVDLDIQEFEVIRNTAIIGGYIEERPAVFAYDIENEKVRTLSNVYQNNSELVEVRVNSDGVTFNVLASKEDFKKDRTIVVSTYDYGGNPIRDYEMVTQRDYNLLSGISSSIYDKEQVVMGLYNIKSGTFPSGIYINHVDRTGRQTMQYINFGEMETFLDHNGERKAEKLKEKALQAKKSNKDWRYKTDGLFDELIETPDSFILFGEFFKPYNMTTQNYLKNRSGWYSFSNSLNNLRNARTYNQSLPTASGLSGSNFNTQVEWDFTHAFAMKIDKKGSVLWDRSFDIDEDLEGSLRKFGAFEYDNDKAYYSYYFDEELVVKYMNDKEALAANEPIQLMNEEEKLRYENEGYTGIIPWYKNRFLVFGVQTIKGASSEDAREVFFVNSIEAKPISAEEGH